MESNTHQRQVLFLHSLFRSGSTYIYNAIKRTGLFHAYHEPMHEVIASLADSWEELSANQQQIKSILRHDFLRGSYFDEYSHILDEIKKSFDQTLSFDHYFMQAFDESTLLKNYIDLLVESSKKPPVIQCTRTAGRIDWLKKNYPSKHVFLLRNPWDQWYSYKVDPYISITPRLAYSSKDLPDPLKNIIDGVKINSPQTNSIHDRTSFFINNPIDSSSDYLLFFGLWCHAFISALKSCEIIIDMDMLSASETYRRQTINDLNKIGLGSLEFFDASLPRTLFKEEERHHYESSEEQVLDIFSDHGIDTNPIREYLNRMRDETFRATKPTREEVNCVLEDAARMRKLLRARDNQLARSASDLIDRDRLLAELNPSSSEQNMDLLKGTQIDSAPNPATTLDENFYSMQEIGHSTENKNPIPLGAQAFFTICSKNFLAHARVLHDSVKTHYPNARFMVALCDRVDGLFDPSHEPFEFIYPEELGIPDFPGMSKRYNITELNTSIKPFVFLHIMEHIHAETVVYLDPDIYLVSKMEELDKLLMEGAEAALTPHILNPAENDEVHDGKMLLFGIYNLGFLALRDTQKVREFLSWWGRRLEYDCVIRLEEGLFVDQKWADLLPSFVPGTKIIHHSGYNVAYWNLPQRKITQSDGTWLSNTEKLRFVHFSGNKLDDTSVFSRHSHQVTISNIGDLRILLDSYRDMVKRQGHAFYRKLPYAYSWNGASNVNLHTPEVLDDSAKELNQSFRSANMESNSNTSAPGILNIMRRAGIIRRSLPLAKNLSGGWRPLAHKAWRAYRLHGWSYVKAKAIELSGYRAPPAAPPSETQQPLKIEKKHLRLLYIDWAIPKPDQDAASVTAKLLMEIVESLGYLVTFIPCSLKYEEGYYEDLQNINIEVITYPTTQSVGDWLTKNASKFDICILARGPVVWPYLSLLKESAPNLRLIFNTVDLHYLRELRQADLCDDEAARAAALKLRDQEFDLIQECDATILLSQEEIYSVREINSETALHILPVVFSEIPGAQKPFASRKDILFIGSFPHQPNIDAVLYFSETIYPILKKRIPEITFKVIGSNPPEEIQKLSNIPGIEILGFVKDLEPLFSNIKLSIAPLRYGAGIKGKIGTSLCYGVPCVATPIAIEGMGLVNGDNVLVAESPEKFAEAICTAYLDEKIWSNLSDSGHRFAVENYSVSVIKKRVSNLLETIQLGWKPIFGAVEITGWDTYLNHKKRLNKEYLRRSLLEGNIFPKNGINSFETDGFCCVCNRDSKFLTSFMYSTSMTPDGHEIPNWREHMQCQHCGLVNRVRAGLHAMHTYWKPTADSRIYITEQLTKTYDWLRRKYRNVLGSEYYGPDKKPGSLIDGVRHEDLMNLSLPDNAFDLILSFDVLEHVPQPDLALQEIHRVLAPGGCLIFSAPFSPDRKTDLIRASLLPDGSIEHHYPPEYHGNPVDPEGGALCFRYFSWDIIERMHRIGFNNARCLSYWSEKQGYLGTEQFLFIASK